MNQKRFLALILAAVLLLQGMPLSVLATETGTEEVPQAPVLEVTETQTEEDVPAAESPDIDLEELKGQTYASSKNGTVRYTVLVLDTEKAFDMRYNNTVIYTVQTPIEEIKRAAKKFIADISNANGTNYVAVVSYSDIARIKSGFSTDTEALSQAVDNLRIDGQWANINDALETADALLSEITDEKAIKNVVIFNQGTASAGQSYEYGKYTSEDCSWYVSSTGVHFYAYSNKAVATAEAMMERYNLYSIALFRSFKDVPEQGQSLLNFARRFSRDLQNAGYQEVDNVDDLEFAFGEIADEILTQRGNFKYPGMFIEGKDTVSEYVYSDSYFHKDATAGKDPALATMSLCFELSSWSSNEVANWPDKTRNARALLEELGFDSFDQNAYWNEAPTKDSIGLVAAKKNITVQGDEYVLIALAVRGGGYGSEWASNFTIGPYGDHTGFMEAKENTLIFLDEYIARYVAGDNPEEKKNVKLWLVGFSRAGATAGMAAADINNGLFESEYINPIAPENLYCYTFEAPMGTHNSNRTGTHTNIHNLLNKSDLVPLVAPANWGFGRYGQTHYFAATNIEDVHFNALKAEMLEQLAAMGFGNEEYLIAESYPHPKIKVNLWKILPGGAPWYETESVYDEPTKIIYENGLILLTDSMFGGRAGYYATLEQCVRDILGIVMHADGIDDGIKEELLSIFDISTILELLKPIFSLNPTYTLEERVEDVNRNISDYVYTILGDKVQWKAGAAGLVTLLTKLFTDAAIDLFEGNAQTVEVITLFAKALMDSEFQAHYPEITLAWVRSQDPNYNDSLPQTEVSHISRVMRINCPVDVFVYDANENIVASIVDDIAGQNNQIMVTVSTDGEKTLYLPGNGGYRVEIVARDNGAVSVCLSEHDSMYSGTTRVQNYYDIPIRKGDVITGRIPRISTEELNRGNPQGSSTNYTMQGADGNEIPVDDTHSGEEAYAGYQVVLKTEGNGGRVFGSGNYIKGSYATVEAVILPNVEFYGWYIGEELVSTDLTYRFAVRSDVELTAKFSDVDFYNVTFVEGNGGVVENENCVAPAGVSLVVSAYPDACHVFDHWSADGGEFLDAGSRETEFVMPAGDVTITANWGYSDPSFHNLGQWYVEQPYCCTDGGNERRDCANCDFAEIRPIEPMDHIWEDENAPVRTCSRCGFSEQSGYVIRLDAELVGDAKSAWIDGVEYALNRDAVGAYVILEQETATNAVVYSYNDPDAEDVHTQYPVGMKVWILKCDAGKYSAAYVPEFDDLLRYSGSSIRIKGVKGIRMITSIVKENKKALTGAGLAGYTLEEYGTALAWASEIDPALGLTLGQSYTKSNYAYKKGESDPIYKDTGELIQYTNVLVGFNDDQCIPDIAMRPYIILRDADGNVVTIYGGVIYRSIGYIAYQNRNAFAAGSASYDYVWGIIHHVYGNAYDEEFKG